jgi:N-acyl-D-amino-acid deacylase
MDYDLKIVGGTIVDGSGRERYRGDVGVRDGRVVALGRAAGSAAETLDAGGMVLAPGFVDIHTHYDAQLFWDPELTISPWHGVTSVVVGNCGFGIAPTSPPHRDLILRTLERVEGMSLDALQEGIGAEWPFESFPEYMDAIEKLPLSINVAVMVGHTPIRLNVMGDESTQREARGEEIAAMRRIVRGAMDAGAVGFATSVSKVHIGYSGKPVPSRLASFDEMLQLVAPLAELGRGIVQYNVGREPRWDEYEALHKASGAAVCWTALLAGSLGPDSHKLHLSRAAEQRAAGLDIWPQGACRPIQIEFDFHSPVTFDTWASFEALRKVGTDEERKRVYADPAFRKRIRTQVEGRCADDAWFAGKEAEGDTRRSAFRLLVVSAFDADPSLVERKLADIAAERGAHPVDVMFDLALQSNLDLRLRTSVVNFDEAAVREIVRDPNIVIGLGDGGAHLSQLCDACYATYLLGHWVRETGALTLEQGVHHLTGRPASIFGLTDRGLLAVGRPADIVVFDPQTVHAGPLKRLDDLPARAERLVSYPVGIQAVYVNGTRLAAPHAKQGKPSGRLLRSGRAA